MGFWNNFARDYFGTGLNNTARNTMANVLLGLKGRKLLDIITGKKKTDGTSTTTDNSPDTMYDSSQGSGQQDLNKQPKPDYGAPTSAGQSGVDTGQEEVNVEPRTQPYTSEDNNPTGTETQTPVATEGNYLINGFAGTQPPLATNKDKNKVPSNVLLDELRTQEDRNKYNQNLAKQVLDYQLYAQRFGDTGQKYSGIMGDAYSKYYQPMPTEPKFDEKKIFPDAQGNLYQLKYNFITKSYDAIPVSTGEKQLQTDLPKYDKDRIHFEMDKDGNAVIRNLQNNTTIPLGMPYDQFDPEFKLKDRELNITEAYKMGLLDIQQAKLLMQQGKGGTGNSGDGTGTGIVQGDDGSLTVDGVPLEPAEQRVSTGRLIQVPDATQPSGYRSEMEYKTERGYKINGNFVDMADIDKIVGQVGQKGLTPYQRTQLKYYGIDVDKNGNFIDVTKTKSKQEEGNWKKLWDTQYKRFQNPKDPHYEEAKVWLSKKENRDYAKKLGLIP